MTSLTLPEDIWHMLRENAEQLKALRLSQQLSQQENDHAFKELRLSQQLSQQENDHAFKELRLSQQLSQQENDHAFKELRLSQQLSQQENDHAFKELRLSQQLSQQEHDQAFKALRLSQQETDLKFQETDRLFKATDKKLNQLEDLFTSQWGRLIESLVEGDLVRILKQRGIAIVDTSTRLKGKRADGGNYEFDILAHNGKEVVVVEVKTTLRPVDVKKFLFKLDHFKTWVPRYHDNTVYGGMGWLTVAAGADTMLEKKGLFNIRATGNSASIVNADIFLPKAW